MQAPDQTDETGHPSAHRCTDDRCTLIRIERDELRLALRMIEAGAHHALSPTSSTAAA